MEELVSIIMAAYNAENTIEMAIDSVLAQTYFNWELIIVNDCSTDNTKSIVEAYSKKDERIKLYSNEENLGVSKTRLKAVQLSNGNWIAILDSDDAWMPEKLAKQFELQNEINAELLYTGSSFMDEEGEKYNWIMEVPKTVSYKELLKQNILSNSSALIKKDLYMENYVLCDSIHEDFATWLRVLSNGATAYGVNEPLLVYRLSKNSKSGNKIHSAKMNWNTYHFLRIGILESIYYMTWYFFNSIRKYKNLRK